MLYLLVVASGSCSDEAKPVPTKRKREGGTCTYHIITSYCYYRF